MEYLPFHLALPVTNVDTTTAFYRQILKCEIGRSSYNWVDINFYGHQITFQERSKVVVEATHAHQNGVGPVAHFGVVLPWEAWHETVAQFEQAGVAFMIEPDVVMEGQVGEQMRFFISDPDGYGIEFKSFQNPENLFRSKP